MKKIDKKIPREAYGKIAWEQEGCGCDSSRPDTREFAKSTCIDPDTKDPIARAILDGLGEGKLLQGYVVSVYVKGYK